MANEVTFEDPFENSEVTESEQAMIQRIREEAKEDSDLLSDIDLVRIIRGYDSEKEVWAETWRHVELFVNEALKEGYVDLWREPCKIGEEATANLTEWLPMAGFGQDKQGHPVVYEKVCDYNLAEAKAAAPELVIGYRDHFSSKLYKKNMSESQRRGVTIYKQIRVFDLNGIGIFGAKPFLDMVKRTIDREGDLFPENIYKIFIVNTGWSFRAIWTVVSAFIHSATRAKIQILGGQSKFLPALREQINDDQIPKMYGGSNTTDMVWNDVTFFTEDWEAPEENITAQQG